METLSEENRLMPDWERFYLFRVESYLIHKYQPELVDTLKLTFARARLRREGFVEHSDIIMSKEEFTRKLEADLQMHVPWKPKSLTHKRGSLERPNIGADYQDRFREL